MPLDAREAADQRRAVARLELVELGSVDQARDDLANVVAGAAIGGNDTVDFPRFVVRRLRFDAIPLLRQLQMQVTHDLAHDADRLSVVSRKVIGNARNARVDVGPAELLGRYDLTGGGFD